MWESKSRWKMKNVMKWRCNEKADAAAKSALFLPITRMKLPATGMYPCITKLIFDEWQEVWDCCIGNKLHAIRSTVGDCKQKTWLSRRDTVLLSRLHIGHTRLTHSYLLSGIGVNFLQIVGELMALSFPSPLLSSPPFPPPFPFPLLRSRPPNPARGSGAEPHPKSNLVHFSLKIRHLVATILMIFVRVNWTCVGK